MFRRLAIASEEAEKARLKDLQQMTNSHGRMSSPMWDELRRLEKKYKQKPAYSPMPKWPD